MNRLNEIDKRYEKLIVKCDFMIKRTEWFLLSMVSALLVPLIAFVLLIIYN